MRVVFGTICICSSLLAVHSREDLDGESAALVQTTKVLDLVTEVNGDNVVMELTANGDVHQLKNEELDKSDKGLPALVKYFTTWIKPTLVTIWNNRIKKCEEDLDFLSKKICETKNIAKQKVIDGAKAGIKKAIKKFVKLYVIDVEELQGRAREIWEEIQTTVGRATIHKWFPKPCLVSMHQPAREAHWLNSGALEATNFTLPVSFPKCDGGKPDTYNGMDACTYDEETFKRMDKIQMSWGCKLAVVVGDDFGDLGCANDNPENLKVTLSESWKQFPDLYACRVVVVPNPVQKRGGTFHKWLYKLSLRVINKGFIYRVLADDVPANSEEVGCDRNFKGLPFGYKIAPPNAEVIAVIASHTWGTDKVVTSDRNTYGTQTMARSREPGTVVDAGGESLVDEDGKYKAKWCNSRILIRKPQ